MPRKSPLLRKDHKTGRERAPETVGLDLISLASQIENLLQEGQEQNTAKGSRSNAKQRQLTKEFPWEERRAFRWFKRSNE